MQIYFIEHPGYIEVDGKIFSGVVIVDFPREIDESLIKNIIYIDIPIDIIMFYEKINSLDVIKKLTYHLGNVKSEINVSSKNKEDYEILNITYSDAQEIRRELQINNESIYNFYLYITLYADSVQQLNQNINSLQAMLASYGIISKVPYFRHIGLYKNTNPFNINSKDIKFDARRNMISKTLGAFYPFISNNIYDKSGILYGYDDQSKSIVIIDRFDNKKYLNSNMIIFGTSGAGKSYFVKLQIMRNSLLDIKQLVIDPEGEYKNICEQINGEYISLGNNNGYYINIFDIYEDFDITSEKSILENKIQDLMIFFTIALPDLNNVEKAYLEEKIIQIYNNKNINFDNNSLYNKYSKDKILLKPKLKTSKEFPIMQDLYDVIKKDNKYSNLEFLLKKFISGSLRYFNNYSNFDKNSKNIIIDISKIKEEYFDMHLFIIIEMFWNIIKQDNQCKKIIYIDEIWRLLNNKTNNLSADFVVQIFKTIRKYKGAATAITQDIYDLSTNGNVYGKSIINNSFFKCIFKVDAENTKNLANLINITENEMKKIRNIKRGECLFMLNNNNSIIKISSSKYEQGIIEQLGGGNV